MLTDKASTRIICCLARVFQFGPPSILDSSTSQTSAKLGEDAKLTCDSFAIPLPEKVYQQDYN